MRTHKTEIVICAIVMALTFILILGYALSEVTVSMSPTYWWNWILPVMPLGIVSVLVLIKDMR